MKNKLETKADEDCPGSSAWPQISELQSCFQVLQKKCEALDSP